MRVWGRRRLSSTCPDEEAGHKAVEGRGDAVDDTVEDWREEADAVTQGQAGSPLSPLLSSKPEGAL